MKMLKVLVLFMSCQMHLAQVHAATERDSKEIVKVIDDQVIDLEVAMNRDTVLCLVGDYSASSLKISIPAIKFYTELDHTSPGAPGPCINAGRCNGLAGSTDTRLSIFHNERLPTEVVKLRVLKEEVIQVVKGASGNICYHQYREHLFAIIRGIPFFHQAALNLAPIEDEACQGLSL